MNELKGQVEALNTSEMVVGGDSDSTETKLDAGEVRCDILAVTDGLGDSDASQEHGDVSGI